MQQKVNNGFTGHSERRLKESLENSSGHDLN
jgi:hypothetical protein